MNQSPFNQQDIIKMIREGKNPQQVLLNLLDQQAQNNPMYANLATLARENRGKEIEAIARNLAKERGIDFDKEFMNFRRTYGL
jgi:hypothetical protein